MRILHVISVEAVDLPSMAPSDGGFENVVLAPEDSNAGVVALQRGVPVVWVRPGTSRRMLRQAMQVLQPDLVHLHGARAADRVAAPSIWADRAMVLALQPDDFDEDGVPFRDVRGIRLNRNAAGRALVTVPRGQSVPLPNQLPFGVGEAVRFDAEGASALGWQRLYDRALDPAAASAGAGLRAVWGQLRSN